MYFVTISHEVKNVASSMTKDIIVISMGKSNRPNRVVK